MLNPIKLLLVDDNPVDSTLIRRLLANDSEQRYEYYEIDVVYLCESSLSIITKATLEKQVTLHHSFDPHVHTISGDAHRLKQVLVNLLLNAVKFTPVGGQVGLEVKAEPEQEIASFCVWDTGIGIALKDQLDLFEPFTQLDSSLSRAYEGTGLGLALVARLIELHHGSMSLESSLGQGSRFTVRLPWQPAPAIVGAAPTLEL